MNAQTLPQYILSSAAKSEKICGAVWPADAGYAVVSTTSTWPCGWSKNYVVEFYKNEEDLRKSFETDLEWARLEDNHLARRVFAWDLGQVEIKEYAINPTQIADHNVWPE